MPDGGRVFRDAIPVVDLANGRNSKNQQLLRQSFAQEFHSIWIDVTGFCAMVGGPLVHLLSSL
jgi:hypothetical protein